MFIYAVLFIAGFIAFSYVPFFASHKLRKRFPGLVGFVLAVVISTSIMSGVVITQVLGYKLYLEHKVALLDRNGDGFWTPDETVTWTEEDRKTMDAFIGDGGRNAFAVIMFPAFSLLYSLSIASGYWLFSAAKPGRKKA